ncbi:MULTISPECIES: DUF6166 domain-containing protein [Caproicibacterium]|uniref:DUF6166 domain-containing protein n=1 Tax=Caproicibacterium TaxID=2834348 RepID=UPI003899218D
MESVICARCGRKLKSPAAVAAGYGSCCYRKEFGTSLPGSSGSHSGHASTHCSASHGALKTPEPVYVGPVGPLFQHDIICSRDADGKPQVNVTERVHSQNSGFDWGAPMDKQTNLALNILSAFVGQEAAEKDGLYFKFRDAFISNMPSEGGIIKKEAILTWIASQGVGEIDG